MPIKPIFAAVDEAKKTIENLSVADMHAELADEDALVVDIREIQERVDLGTIPGSKHAPRGMLEFWADPASPYYRDWFDKPERRIVLFCAGGGRSALAAVALKDMGFTNVAHLEPGFTGWQQEQQEIEDVQSTSRWIRRPKP